MTTPSMWWDNGLYLQQIKAVLQQDTLHNAALFLAMAHQLLDMRQFERAQRYFQLNIDNYPASELPYAAMGGFYEAKGDKAQAKAYYLKALAIRGSADLLAKIRQLESN